MICQNIAFIIRRGRHAYIVVPAVGIPDLERDLDLGQVHEVRAVEQGTQWHAGRADCSRPGRGEVFFDNGVTAVLADAKLGVGHGAAQGHRVSRSLAAGSAEVGWGHRVEVGVGAIEGGGAVSAPRLYAAIVANGSLKTS